MNQANTQHFQHIPFKLPPSRLQTAEFGHESGGEGAVKTDFRGRAEAAARQEPASSSKDRKSLKLL